MKHKLKSAWKRGVLLSFIFALTNHVGGSWDLEGRNWRTQAHAVLNCKNVCKGSKSTPRRLATGEITN